MSEELKPCPFCGGRNIFNGHGYNVCEDCKDSMADDHIWNNRPIEDDLRRRLEEAKKQLAAANAENEQLREALLGFIDISDQSCGIAGWHLNGDIASWEEFACFEEAKQALAAQDAICHDCGREKAHSVEDINNGLCPKWYAVNDNDAERDCREYGKLRKLVTDFSKAMLEKLIRKFSEGYVGWDSEEFFISFSWYEKLMESAKHPDSTDEAMVNVANYAAFMWARNQRDDDTAQDGKDGE